MKIRGLFFILVMVLLTLVIPVGAEHKSAYLIAAIVIGWILDYFVDHVRDWLKNKKSKSSSIQGKVLDSSVIIDGRIIDIVESDFLEGKLIVPKFVLDELQILSDSEDSMKRARGRRGLDLIKTMQTNIKDRVDIIDKDYKANDVDSKLVQLAKEENYDLITTDYNLNKVATIRGVKVLNINKLSNALKPRVIPNEELEIELIKKGDRDGQAVGYLNDGTMVVAEDGKEYLGTKIVLVVTSVYPTAAGRMIFGRVKK